MQQAKLISETQAEDGGYTRTTRVWEWEDGSKGTSTHYAHREGEQINANGFAHNGNTGALIVAAVVCAGIALGGLVQAFQAVF